jgi:hypothetical protein
MLVDALRRACCRVLHRVALSEECTDLPRRAVVTSEVMVIWIDELPVGFTTIRVRDLR